MPDAASPGSSPEPARPQMRPAPGGYLPHYDHQLRWIDGALRVVIAQPAARARMELEWAREHERLEQRRKEWAEEAAKARVLLWSLLDSKNRWLLQHHNYIEVTGSEGGLYRIHADSFQGNVLQLADSDGNATGLEYCAHPRMYSPDEDGYAPIDHAVIAQMALLRTDEARFLHVALDA